MRNMQKIIEGKNFAGIDDLNAFLASMAGPASRHLAMGSPHLSAREEAQDLVFKAMEARSEAQTRKLVKQALARDPDCVDALVMLAGLDATSPEQAIASLQAAVTAGERSLGASFIRENKGHFWGILDTRPYMRALAELADLLRGEERYPEAIPIYEKMLELNPNDNQGVRDQLLGVYLAVGDVAGAGRLLKKYKDDSMANFAWGRVLERFLAGDGKGAETALAKARKTNRFVEIYLTGQQKPPMSLPDSYSMGSEEEAILCLDAMMAAWAAHREAVFWLLEQVLGRELPVPSGCKQAKLLRMAPAAPGKKPQ